MQNKLIDEIEQRGDSMWEGMKKSPTEKEARSLKRDIKGGKHEPSRDPLCFLFTWKEMKAWGGPRGLV